MNRPKNCPFALATARRLIGERDACMQDARTIRGKRGFADTQVQAHVEYARAVHRKALAIFRETCTR